MPSIEELRAGHLVAIRLAPGPAWVPLLARLWEAGAAFLSVDHRLPSAEARRLISRAAPTHVLDEGGLTAVPGPWTTDEGAALVVATSGTSGEPRLVELSRAAVEAAVRGSAAALEGEGRWLCCLPLGHVGGLLTVLRPLLLGGEVVLHPRFDPRLVDEEPEVAFVSVVPTMLARLLEARADLTRFRAVLVGGAGLAEDLAARATEAGARVVSTYGLTETCGGVVYDGVPFEGTEVRIEDPEAGGTGEILLRGPTLMTGYRGDPDTTERFFTPGRRLRTGDLGRLDADGRLVVEGRADELILTGGEKVWPEEVEAVLRTHPKVADVAVAGRPDPEWGERVTAFVVPADPAEPPRLEDMRDHVGGSLPRFKAPGQLVLVGSIPRTASGKVRRPELPS